MGKWILRLDSAGQKGPEITLEGILIVVEGCFTAERTCGSGLGRHRRTSPEGGYSPRIYLLHQ
jgi:hypothetical protein